MSYISYLCLFVGGRMAYVSYLCLFVGGRMSYVSYLCLFVGGRMAYISYLCLFSYSGVPLWVCILFSSSCVSYVASFPGLSCFDCHCGIL